MATFKALKSDTQVLFCHSTLTQMTFFNGTFSTECPNQIKQLNENPACEAIDKKPAPAPAKKKEGGE